MRSIAQCRTRISAVPIVCTKLKSRSSWLHASDLLTHPRRHLLHDMPRLKYKSVKVIQQPPVLVVLAYLCPSTVDQMPHFQGQDAHYKIYIVKVVLKIRDLVRVTQHDEFSPRIGKLLSRTRLPCAINESTLFIGCRIVVAEATMHRPDQ